MSAIQSLSIINVVLALFQRLATDYLLSEESRNHDSHYPNLKCVVVI